MTTIPVHNIEGLIEDIDKGYARYCNGGARAERLGGAYQVHVALRLLMALMPDNAAKLAPLFHVYEELMGLNWGVTGDMLKPEKWNRKPPIAMREAFERAHLAATMHFKMEANKLAGGHGEKEQAAREVGTRFNVGYRKIDDWREHAMTESPENDPIAWRFRYLIDALSGQFHGRPDKIADWLMKARLGAHLV